jgi:hypothetical protein
MTTKSERIAQDKLRRYLYEAHLEDPLDSQLRREVPDAWHTLEQDLDVTEKKVKLTLMLDASVAKVFRAMGRGYQARINRILATWVQLKMSGLMDENYYEERVQVDLAVLLRELAAASREATTEQPVPAGRE